MSIGLFLSTTLKVLVQALGTKEAFQALGWWRLVRLGRW